MQEASPWKLAYKGDVFCVDLHGLLQYTAYECRMLHALTIFYLLSIIPVLQLIVTVQYLHSYDAKSIPNRLRRWDFALLNHYLTVSAVKASTCTE